MNHNGKFVGKFRDNQRFYGTYTYNVGDKYEGDWRDNKKHGVGTYWYVNGDKYKGEWRKGVRSGKGILTFASGIIT